MKKYLFLLLVVVTGLSACKPDSTYDSAGQAVKDDAAIQAYFAANNVTGTVKDPSGLYYKVVTPGTGAYPTSASTVTVSYVGTLLNGNQFDANTSFTASLNGGVISGWTIGVPHINTGGKIILYIPSGMGYGNTATGSIPASSVLVFTITLISFK